MEIYGYRIPKAASLLLWAGLWEIVGQAHLTILIPPLSRVLVRLVEIVPTWSFLAALGITARAYLAGVAIAILLGVPLGLAMGRSLLVDRLVLPWVSLFVSAPLTALVPVIMALFGFGETTIVLTVVLFAIWIVVLDTRAGVRHIAPSLIEMARSYGASRWALFGKVIVLAALPEILAGIRLGLIRGVKGVVIGQLLVSIVGYGALFETYSRNFRMTQFWALTIILFAFAMVLAALIEWAEDRVDYYAGARE